MKHRLLPLLAITLLLLRVLGPVSFAGVPGPADGHLSHQNRHPAGTGPAGGQEPADQHHQVCHFCRFLDVALPPPALVAIVPLPVFVPVAAPKRTEAVPPARDFLVRVQARAPPQLLRRADRTLT